MPSTTPPPAANATSTSSARSSSTATRPVRRRPRSSPLRRRFAPAGTSRGASPPAAAPTPTRCRRPAFNASTSRTAPSETTSRPSACPWRRSRRCSTWRSPCWRPPPRHEPGGTRMLTLRRGTVLSAGDPAGPMQEVEVRLGGDRRPALADVALVGPAPTGDEVVVNVAALDLRLGSGGYDIVHVNLTRGLRGSGVPGAHVLKLNYTSLQHTVRPVEETRPARAGPHPPPPPRAP